MRKAILIVWITVLIHIILVNQLLAAKVSAIPHAYSLEYVLEMRGCVYLKNSKPPDSVSFEIKGPILQNHLLEISRSKDVFRFRCDINPTWQSQLKKYHIKLNREAMRNKDFKKREITGLLFAVSDSGCFLYNWETSVGTYIPFSITSTIHKGVPPRTVVKKMVLGSTGFYTVIGLAGAVSNDGLIGPSGSVIIGAVSGLVLGVHVSILYVVGKAITMIDPRVRYKVNCSVHRGIDFRKKLKSRGNSFQLIDIDHFDLDSAWCIRWRDNRLDTTADAKSLADFRILKPVVLPN